MIHEGPSRKGRKALDVTGRKFQMLTALAPTDKRDSKGFVIWRCRCDCGREIEVSYNRLAYSTQVSCGCRRQARSQALPGTLTRVADTSIDSLKSSKLPKNNTTGHRGVYLIRGKYVAKINFQKKAYYLGAYDSLEDAVKARETAREQLFTQVAEFYRRWKLRAEEDPQWGKENPVQITVEQREKAEFHLALLPVLTK